MNNAQIEIQLIASLVAMACAIPGTFLVLRKMAMISDAISHSILPGIVIGFFITQDLNSPLLIALATFGIRLSLPCRNCFVNLLTTIFFDLIKSKNGCPAPTGGS